MSARSLVEADPNLFDTLKVGNYLVNTNVLGDVIGAPAGLLWRVDKIYTRVSVRSCALTIVGNTTARVPLLFTYRTINSLFRLATKDDIRNAAKSRLSEVETNLFDTLRVGDYLVNTKASAKRGLLWRVHAVYSNVYRPNKMCNLTIVGSASATPHTPLSFDAYMINSQFKRATKDDIRNAAKSQLSRVVEATAKTARQQHRRPRWTVSVSQPLVKGVLTLLKERGLPQPIDTHCRRYDVLLEFASRQDSNVADTAIHEAYANHIWYTYHWPDYGIEQLTPKEYADLRWDRNDVLKFAKAKLSGKSPFRCTNGGRFTESRRLVEANLFDIVKEGDYVVNTQHLKLLFNGQPGSLWRVERMRRVAGVATACMLTRIDGKSIHTISASKFRLATKDDIRNAAKKTLGKDSQ